MTPYRAADPSDPPIADVAAETVWLEQAQPLEGPGEVSLGDSFSRLLPPDIVALFFRPAASGPARIYQLRNVLLDAWIMVLFRGRQPIRETAYLAYQEECDLARRRPLELLPTDPGRHYIIGTTRARENYYHWMVQSLPAIDWGLRLRPPGAATLALPPLQPFQAETLALLGHAGAPRLILGVREHYAFASAWFAEFLTGRLPGIVSLAAAATYARLRQAVSPAADGADAIYVARTDSANRSMANEAALAAMLERRGVRVIAPGSLPVARQLALFRGARLVIGPHGAGLSNVVACEPGAHVYELLPGSYPNHCYNRLAQTCGLHYWGDVFPGDAPDGDVAAQTWRVDLDVVARRLDTIRQRSARANHV